MLFAQPGPICSQQIGKCTMRLYFFILVVVLLTSCSAAQPAILTVASSIPPTELLSPPNPSPTFPPAYDPVFEQAQCFTADLRGSLPDSGYELECGYLSVPEDRSQSEGRSVKLPVVIFHTQSSNPKPDPVIYLTPGGGFNLIPIVSFYM